MEFWMIIMQIAHTETLLIDKDVFIGLPEEGIATRKKQFYKYRQLTSPISNIRFSLLR